METLEKVIGYKFENREYLQTALTHSSYANEHRCKSYERLEFLGDSVLSIIVSEYLFYAMKDNNEGDLSRIRASLVCEESLSELASKLKLGQYIFLGKGEERSGSRERSSILSDVFESVLAAIYLDSDINVAKDFLLNIMKEKLDAAISGKGKRDNKTIFQEYIQKHSHGRAQINYITVDETGPEHMKHFIVELVVNGKTISRGEGSSKKEAEQQAAKNALDDKIF